MIEPYKRRAFRDGEDSWVYRNLMRSDGPWYSIVQRGVVVAHATELVVLSPRFVVRQAGRHRVIATGVKNVHAFVRGVVVIPHAGPSSSALPTRAGYNPRAQIYFEVTDPAYVAVNGRWNLHACERAHLGRNGLTVELGNRPTLGMADRELTAHPSEPPATDAPRQSTAPLDFTNTCTWRRAGTRRA